MFLITHETNNKKNKQKRRDSSLAMSHGQGTNKSTDGAGVVVG